MFVTFSLAVRQLYLFHLLCRAQLYKRWTALQSLDCSWDGRICLERSVHLVSIGVVTDMDHKVSDASALTENANLDFLSAWLRLVAVRPHCLRCGADAFDCVCNDRQRTRFVWLRLHEKHSIRTAGRNKTQAQNTTQAC